MENIKYQLSNVSVVPFCDAYTRYAIHLVLDKKFNIFGLFLQAQEVGGWSLNINLNFKLVSTWNKTGFK